MECQDIRNVRYPEVLRPARLRERGPCKITIVGERQGAPDQLHGKVRDSTSLEYSLAHQVEQFHCAEVAISHEAGDRLARPSGPAGATLGLI